MVKKGSSSSSSVPVQQPEKSPPSIRRSKRIEVQKMMKIINQGEQEGRIIKKTFQKDKTFKIISKRPSTKAEIEIKHNLNSTKQNSSGGPVVITEDVKIDGVVMDVEHGVRYNFVVKQKVYATEKQFAELKQKWAAEKASVKKTDSVSYSLKE